MVRSRYDDIADFYVDALRRHDLQLDEMAEPTSAESWAASVGPAVAGHTVQFVARCVRI
jgi:hypothetical protein